MYRPRERLFCGIFTALITPFNKAGDRVDLDSLADLVGYSLDQGAHGFFVCGGAGESVYLKMNERQRIAETVVRVANGRPVIVHVGHADAEVARRLAEHAAIIGADAIAALAVTDGDLGRSAADLNYLARQTDLPFFAYYRENGNKRPGSDFARFIDLARRIQPLSGLKITSRQARHLDQAGGLRDPANLLSVFSGKDQVFLEALDRYAADGAISALANIAALAMVKIYNLLPNYRTDAAAENERLQKVNSQLFKTNGHRPNNLAIIKQILYRQGIIASPAVRNGQAACPAKRADKIIELMQ